MSRIEVQRSNSRNKIIAITIAISSRTMKPARRQREGEEGREEERERERVRERDEEAREAKREKVGDGTTRWW